MTGQTGLGARNPAILRALTCLMFLMFAMTSDAVGSVIPNIIGQFHLSMKAASAFQYAPMAAMALGALTLGFLADRLGHKWTIVLGLALYGMGSALFALADHFGQFVTLLAIGGLGVSVFKTGALALVGDLSRSTTQHTSFMNLIEGCFGIGSIIGPAIVAVLLVHGLSWKWLYVIAAGICALLVILALLADYPARRTEIRAPASLAHTLALLRDPYALTFSGLISLYVSVEVAIYVWMPTYLRIYHGPLLWMVPYALTAFFVLRAAGRLVGAWMLSRFSWSTALALLGLAILGCFAGSLAGGPQAGLVLLPLSGLFMSVIYPTINSKGISGFPKSEHGRVAGLLLAFTAFAAAVGPFAMGAVSDAYHSPKYGFELAAGFALLLATGLVLNAAPGFTARRLRRLDQTEYSAPPGPPPGALRAAPTPGR